ncbi:MAG: hypothetical protein R2705_09825 [Ilumatobacteraceae bacterium]
MPTGTGSSRRRPPRLTRQAPGGEGELVGEYERLVASSIPYVSFLAGLMRRGTSAAITGSTKSGSRASNIAELSSRRAHRVSDAEHVTELRTILDRLTEAELQDIEDLDELQQRRRHAGPDPVRLVLEVMRMDTEAPPHLEFVKSSIADA